MSAMVDRTQVDGYAPDVRMIEDVTSGDLQSRSITIGELTIVPWMSESGMQYFLSGVKLRNMRMAERDRVYFAKRDGMLLAFGVSI